MASDIPVEMHTVEPSQSLATTMFFSEDSFDGRFVAATDKAGVVHCLIGVFHYEFPLHHSVMMRELLNELLRLRMSIHARGEFPDELKKHNRGGGKLKAYRDEHTGPDVKFDSTGLKIEMRSDTPQCQHEAEAILAAVEEWANEIATKARAMEFT